MTISTFSRLPWSLKLAIGLVAVYALLSAGDMAFRGGTAYWFGRAAATLVVFGIVVWALAAVKQYGWAVSVFLICARMVSHVLDYQKTAQTIDNPQVREALFFSNLVYVALLVAAVGALLLPSSRAPFKKPGRETGGGG